MYYVYMLTNRDNKVLYTGVTNNLHRRIYEHKNKLYHGFTKRYNLNKLVYYTEFSNINDAIATEKKIKGWKRARKNELVETKNPKWNELSI